MREFISFTLGGISFGMVYAAIGLSLVLIWRATRILNYAQGGMAMFTTFIALSVIKATGSYWAGFAAALGAGFVLGAVIERVVIRPVENKPPLNAVIVTIGLLIFLEGLAGIIYGGQFRSFPAALSITGLKVGSSHIALSQQSTCSSPGRSSPPHCCSPRCSGTRRSGCACGPRRSSPTSPGCSASGSAASSPSAGRSRA